MLTAPACRHVVAFNGKVVFEVGALTDALPKIDSIRLSAVADDFIQVVRATDLADVVEDRYYFGDRAYVPAVDMFMASDLVG
ncbi:PTS sugar transporter subunit IIA [Natronococcus wangiae]|uniref:hypothetical protein n=1 Tax=Natronococcus wangiae TaxID=3068275 RepID=UPI00273F7737|nr:hypothetical protein [Natronococcus sp. AD5]